MQRTNLVKKLNKCIGRVLLRSGHRKSKWINLIAEMWTKNFKKHKFIRYCANLIVIFLLTSHETWKRRMKVILSSDYDPIMLLQKMSYKVQRTISLCRNSFSCQKWNSNFRTHHHWIISSPWIYSPCWHLHLDLQETALAFRTQWGFMIFLTGLWYSFNFTNPEL